jgi:hypothetical protein
MMWTAACLKQLVRIISQLFGIVIRTFFNNHRPPHVQVADNAYKASNSVCDT